ncbi:MAG: amino acid permease [Chitinispirillaceae bacterium]|nr:amino acid permease [Chitinispirillaceae bacterium]
MTTRTPSSEAAKFSTFGGVFTPSILTILGVIMFMRAGFVLGHAGILSTLLILGISKLITILTGLSISAIATNTDVKGGGAYFLISRTLGPEFGGTIGLALYMAQTLSVPFYILGFTEAVVTTVPVLKPWFAAISFITMALIFLVTFKGADLAIKAQYFIMGILGISILAFMGGGLLKFDHAMFAVNFRPHPDSEFQFWPLFAIYFPAVTGIMAGVNMSGDLKNPSKSIPLGTFAAIGVGLLIYGGQILICGGSVAREDLITRPYQSLMNMVPLHLGILVAFGVFAATLSSALGSLLGAPRILQSLGKDRLLTPANPFAATTRSGEPRRALLLTTGISIIVLYFARGGGEGGALNVVASVVTMLFLWTYGITNLAAFVESFSRNPSFRPRFKLFHWFPALVGALSCFAVAFLIDPVTALGAVVLIVLLFMYVRRYVSASSFGDARHGFYYSRTRDNLFTLAQMPIHSKNWRPTIIVFSGNPNNRLTLVQYADWLGSGRGIITLAGILTGDFDRMVEQRNQYLSTLRTFIRDNRIRAFPEVLVAPDFELGLNQFLQVTSIGPIKPNVALFGWTYDENRIGSFIQSIRTSTQLGMSTLLLHDHGLPPAKIKKRSIDIWWRGNKNGSLMVILAYLLSLNRTWSGTTIRILRLIPDAAQHNATHAEMHSLIEASRMKITIKIIISRDPFPELLRTYSRDATAIFLGFSLPTAENAPVFHRSYNALVKGLPTTLLVHSTGEADLTS